MPISYSPVDDRIVAQFGPLSKKRFIRVLETTQWWGREGKLHGLAISGFTEMLREFQAERASAQLGGIWKGIKINEEDIRKIRRDLLRSLEKRWEKI
ncbi:MAG TPA: hypothetical protein VN285_13455 [Candidatus Deferrimicrobium sp.]|nr:hypothetical protein [Candidatus Deferrimicrobium sp.]